MCQGELHLGERSQEKFLGDQELGRSHRGQESEVNSTRNKKNEENPPEDFRQCEFPMKLMLVVRDSLLE
jgi:hypothetical protein